MAKQEKISVREFARRIHVTEGAIRKAIDSGKITTGYDLKEKKIIFDKAYKEYGQIKTAPKAGHGISKKNVADKLESQPATGPNNSNADEDIEDEELGDMTYDELIKKLKIYAGMSYKEALRRGEIINLAQNKIKLDELQGNLVKKAEVDKALFDLGSDLKTQLQNIPNRCISMLRSASTDVEATNILTYEINQVLNEFASKL
ncbi:MAG: hypothetical protein ACXWDO_00290 [Bacteroidia bacterium]